MPVLKNLKDYASQPDLDLGADQAALAADRDRLVEEARQRLTGYPEPARERFEFLLKAAQMGVILSEDHGFWIDFSGLYRVRGVFMELGRRLAEGGALDCADDVFYLTVEEVLETEDMLGHAGLCRSLVAERKAEMERFRRISPPPVLGTDYGPPPDDPFNRFMMKFFGGPPPASDAPDVVKGHAGSPGKVRGTARVIHSLQEAAKLEPGDILVAETTAPPWTPLFATAGGIVTDTGGILSHCAVVAREYRIPAVVGTGRATTTIRDGQLIEVDGDTGTVRVLGG
jgi:pyruvate,water dikinase